MSRLTIVAPVLLAAALGACAAPETGIRSPEKFAAVAETTVVNSKLEHTAVARCFEERATLLPTSTFSDYPEAGETVYRLRPYGYSFEEISFKYRGNGGSVATVRIAPNLNAKWMADFRKDRFEVLLACAAGAKKS